jgi:hypothetical protein
MIQRTNKIFIGKDINRTAAVVEGMLEQSSVSAGYIFSLVEGEILVLDKFKKVLGIGKTISDTDVIYICQGLAATYSGTNELGTAMTSMRKLRVSDPIIGKNVKSYSGISYAVATQQNTVITPATPVAGTEYILRIIYKDIWEHPGQYTSTYRCISADTSATTLSTAFTAKINAHGGRRVDAVDNTGSFTITGKAIPQCTTGLNDLDPFSLVEFKAVLDYVNSTGTWTTQGGTLTNTAASYGSGMWEAVRDAERAAWGYQGITNRTHYPIILPDVCTVVSATYDIITIEHDNAYLSPDNQYVKHTPLTTQIAFVVPSTGTQEQAVLGVLNSWMGSCPGSFAPVSV